MTKESIKRLKSNRYIGWVIQKIGLSDRRFIILSFDVLMALIAVRVALYFALPGTDAILSSSFFLKQSFVLGCISLSIFMLLQTYRGVWRFFTFRQSMILVLAVGTISIIYWPLLTKASMSPVDIPNQTMVMFFAIYSGSLIVSRIISKLLRFKTIARDAEAQLLTPAFRVLLIGKTTSLKLFKRRYQALNSDRYDILGVILTDSDQDQNEDESAESIEGYEILGRLDDIQDIYENLKSEDLAPHQIIFLDSHNLAQTSQSIMNRLSHELITYGMMKPFQPLRVDPLSLEDVYNCESGELITMGFENKTVLIFGAANQVGYNLALALAKLNVNKVILWDQNVVGLERVRLDLLTVRNPLAHVGSLKSKLQFESRQLPETESIKRFLEQNSVDAVINLRALTGASTEVLNELLPFDIMIQENAQLAAASKLAGVNSYVFTTFEMPHLQHVNALAAVVSDVLVSVNDKVKASKPLASSPYKTAYFSMHLPFVLSPETTQFLESDAITVTQEDIAVCNAVTATTLILKGLAQKSGFVVDSFPLNSTTTHEGDHTDDGNHNDDDTGFEIVAFDTLLKHYGILQKTRFLPNLRRSKVKLTYTWPRDETQQRLIHNAIDMQNVDDVKSILTSGF